MSKNLKNQMIETARVLRNAVTLKKRTALTIPAAVAAVDSSYKGSDVHSGFIFRYATDKLPRGARLVAEVNLDSEVTLYLEDAPGLTDEVLEAAVSWLYERRKLVSLEVAREKVEAAAARWLAGSALSLDEQDEMRKVVTTVRVEDLIALTEEILAATPLLAEISPENAARIHPLGLLGRVFLSEDERPDLYPAVMRTPAWARIAVLRPGGDRQARARARLAAAAGH